MLRGLTPDFTSFNDAEFDEGRFEQHLESNPQLAIAASRYWIRKLQACVYCRRRRICRRGCIESRAAALDGADAIRVGRIPFLRRTCSGGALRYGLGRGAAPAFGSAGGSSQADRALGEELPRNFRKPRGIGRRRDRAPRRAGAGCHAPLRRGHPVWRASTASSRTRAWPTSSPRGSTRRAASRRSPTPICGTHGTAISAGAPTARCGSSSRSHPQLREESSPQPVPPRTIGAPVEHLDLATVIKVSQAVSGEIVLDKLHRHAHAHRDRACGRRARPADPVSRGDEPRIAAEATTGDDAVSRSVCATSP